MQLRRSGSFSCFMQHHALLAAALIVCLFLMCMPGRVDAANADESDFNVALVIDGSGSLSSDLVGAEATDPSNMRYDAISLFLALLTNDGNYVDAIVFNHTPTFLLNTGMQPISGKDAKESLSQAIRSVNVYGDTDIGTALLQAVNAVADQSASNGLKPAVILFSDGRTDLGSDQDAYNASIANKEAAIAKAQENGIPIFTICLQATDVADPSELQSISERTSGDFVVVNSASDLARAFESFYGLIFPSSSTDRVDLRFGDDGILEYGFKVPEYGAREVNIILNGADLSSAQLNTPSSMMDANAIASCTMSGGAYSVVKLVDPERGDWRLGLRGTPGATVTANVIYNVDVSAQLSVAGDATELDQASSTTVVARLYQSGAAVQDASVTQDYSATLIVTNLADGTTSSIDMKPCEDGSFSATFGSDIPASYGLSAHLASGELSLDTNSIELSFSNSAPQLTKGDSVESSAIVTPISGGSVELDLADYFTDAQDGSNLAYSIVSSQLDGDSATLDGSKLTVRTADSKSGALVVRAADSQGATAQLTVQMKVTDTRPFFVVLVVGVIVAAGVIFGLAWWRKTHIRFKGSISVRNANVELAGGKILGHIRGKVPLARFSVQDGGGFNAKKSYFLVVDKRSIVFRSPDQIFSGPSPEARHKVSLNMTGTTMLYADKEHTKGLKVTVECERDYSSRRPGPRPTGKQSSSRRP